MLTKRQDVNYNQEDTAPLVEDGYIHGIAPSEAGCAAGEKNSGFEKITSGWYRYFSYPGRVSNFLCK